MEPVEPRMARFFKALNEFLRLNPKTFHPTTTLSHLEPLVNNLSVPQHGSGQQQGVDAVQNAAVAG